MGAKPPLTPELKQMIEEKRLIARAIRKSKEQEALNSPATNTSGAMSTNPYNVAPAPATPASFSSKIQPKRLDLAKKTKYRRIASQSDDSDEENHENRDEGDSDSDPNDYQNKTTLPIRKNSIENSESESSSYREGSNSDKGDKDDESPVTSDISDDEESEEDVIAAAEARFDSFQAPDPGMTGMYNANVRTRRRTKKKNRRNQKVRDDEYDDEPSDDDPASTASNEINAQEVSIHRINIGHKTLRDCKDEESRISKIIEKYNCPKTKPNPQEGKKKTKRKPAKEPQPQPHKNLYEEQDVNSPPLLKSEDRILFSENEDFHVKIYTQKIKKGIPLLRQYGVERDESSAILVNTLIFHYRTGEIFCLTTAQGWNVVQWCSDFTFPGKVAARILSKEGVIASTVKGIVGNELVSTKVNRKAEEANPFELLNFCTNFKAELRKDASILELSCFKNLKIKKKKSTEGQEMENVDSDDSLPQTRKRQRQPSTSKSPSSGFGSKSESSQTKVLVQAGSIRIQKRFTKSDLLAICFHLSKIARGEPTKNTSGEKELISSAHEQYLTKVQVDLARELDLEISIKIHNAVADVNNGRMEITDNFELNHKYSTDFYDAEHFILYYKGGDERFVEEWIGRPPTFRELIVALRGVNELTDFKGTEKDWMKRLNNVRLRFIKNEKSVGPEKILNFLQGMHTRSGDNNVFFHVQSIWCFVQHSYLALLQRKFQDFLKSHLKNEGLKFPWPTALSSERDPAKRINLYLKQYQKLSNFYVVQDPDGTNLADMIELKTNHQVLEDKYSLVLYYIFPGLNYSALSKTSQVSNSIMKIQKAGFHQGAKNVGGAENAVRMVKKLFQELRAAKPEFKKAFKDTKEFGKLLGGAKIIIAIGQDKENSFRSLQSELEMETKIDVEELMATLEKLEANMAHLDKMDLLVKNLKCGHIPEVAVNLHAMLKAKEYLADDDEITGKFLCQTRASFNLEGLGKSTLFVFENVILPYLPQAGTFLSKLEWIRLKADLDNKLCLFSIVEIQGDENEESDENENGRIVLQDRRIVLQDQNGNTPGNSRIRKRKRNSPASGKQKKRRSARISTSEEDSDSE